MRKKEILSFIFIFLIFPFWGNLSAASSGININLNSNWKFQLDRNKIGKIKNWYEQTDFRGFQQIKVPAFFEDELGIQYDGWTWYFNSFEISEIKERIAIKFDGVDDDATVWINGKLAGSHSGYSEMFYFDITGLIKQGVNTVVVLCEDFGGPGGIYGEVRVLSYQKEEDIIKTEYADKNARPSESWIKDGIIYELYLRAYTQEGTFKSIIPKLNQIKNLGVSIIWIMPINPIGELKRKGTLGSPYSIKDYFDINPEFGTKEDFREFVKEVHKLGMKLIVDVVLNHSSWDNPLIKSNPEFYTRNKKGEIVSPNKDWYDVADFNYANKELRKYMIDMLSYWVMEFDVDGFRCDVAELVPIDFWERARAELDKIKPVFVLSEGTLPQHHLKAFDMTYSWNIYDMLKDLVEGKKNSEEITKAIKTERYVYPKNSLRMRFNENHDKERAVKVFGYDGSFITAALITTIPGVPLIYSGQEVGDSVFASLFEKYTIPWEENFEENEHYRFYKSLFSFRNSNRALIDGSFDEINIDNLYAFQRSSGNNRILAIFNFSDDLVRLEREKLLSLIQKNEIPLENILSRKVSINSVRMGRPKQDDIEFDSKGFLLISY